MLKSLRYGDKIRVASIFGTRPEAIKMMPILREITRRRQQFSTTTIVTSQHTDLLDPLLSLFAISVDYKLGVLRPGQSLDHLFGRLMLALDAPLDEFEPDVVLVQGDTSSALAGALAAHHRKIPVAHIEAGLRSGNRYSPFPEEMNRRLITQLASLHLAATPGNVEALRREGVDERSIVLTGNPVVDALQSVREATQPTAPLSRLLQSVNPYKLLVSTCHRRENFGERMRSNLLTLGKFVARHEDTALIFLVHPNPNVRKECAGLTELSDRIKLVDPMPYPDFLHLLSQAWLIVSDSGGIQEEAPTLGKPLLVLRENTERPEVIDCGFARLTGGDPLRLESMLEDAYADGRGLIDASTMQNPFGDGNAAKHIADAIVTEFGALRHSHDEFQAELVS